MSPSVSTRFLCFRFSPNHDDIIEPHSWKNLSKPSLYLQKKLFNITTKGVSRHWWSQFSWLHPSVSDHSLVSGVSSVRRCLLFRSYEQSTQLWSREQSAAGHLIDFSGGCKVSTNHVRSQLRDQNQMKTWLSFLIASESLWFGHEPLLNFQCNW